jgi:hypothetical protein
LAELLQGDPNREKMLQQARDYLQAARKEHEAQEALYRSNAYLAHASEQLETMLCARFEGLLDGSLSLPEDRLERARWVLQLTIMEHFLPSLKERLARADAREYLLRFLRENPPTDLPSP